MVDLLKLEFLSLVLHYGARLYGLPFLSNLIQLAVVGVCVVSIQLQNLSWLERLVPLRQRVLGLFFLTHIALVHGQVILKRLQFVDLLYRIETLLLLVEVFLLLHLFALHWQSPIRIEPHLSCSQISC